MPSCEYEWRDTYGTDMCDMVVAAEICVKCCVIKNLGCPGIDVIKDTWNPDLPETLRGSWYGLWRECK